MALRIFLIRECYQAVEQDPKTVFYGYRVVRLAGGVDECKIAYERLHGRGYSGNMGLWAAHQEL